MGHLIKGHTRGIELNISRHARGDKPWERIYKNPLTGVKLYFADLGNPSVLGQGYGIIPYITFPFISRRNFFFGFTVGTGYGLITKRFDPKNNHQNIAIGSRVNGMMHGSLEARWQLSQTSTLVSGIALTHYSNGAYKMPNLGINIPSVLLGYTFGFGNLKPDFKQDSLPALSKKINYFLMASGGVKETYPVRGKKYSSWLVSSFLLKPLNRKSSLGLGADIFYNRTLGFLLSDSTGTLAPFSKIIRAGIFIPYEIDVSRISIVIQAGVYLLDSYHEDGSLYQRIGCHYKLNDHLFVNYTLKLHFGRADNLELGLGYRF